MVSVINPINPLLPDRPRITAFHMAEPFEIVPLDIALHDNRNGMPHSHKHFEIIWVTQGKGLLTINNETHELEENLIIYIRPGQVHCFTGIKNMNGFLLSFRSEFFFFGDDAVYGRVLTSQLSPDNRGVYLTKITAATKEKMTGILRNMLAELRNPHFLQSDVLRGFLRIFLIYLTRQIKENSAYNPQFGHCVISRKFFDLLEKRYAVQHKVFQYADNLSVTAAYLNEKVKQDSGFTASFNIQQRIVTEAKRLLLSDHLILKEIAFQLGFEDTAHFSKFFKKASGVNFSEFKRKNGI